MASNGLIWPHTCKCGSNFFCGLCQSGTDIVSPTWQIDWTPSTPPPCSATAVSSNYTPPASCPSNAAVTMILIGGFTCWWYEEGPSVQGQLVCTYSNGSSDTYDIFQGGGGGLRVEEVDADNVKLTVWFESLVTVLYGSTTNDMKVTYTWESTHAKGSVGCDPLSLVLDLADAVKTESGSLHGVSAEQWQLCDPVGPFTVTG